jgi:hypothetical protein
MQMVQELWRFDGSRWKRTWSWRTRSVNKCLMSATL